MYAQAKMAILKVFLHFRTGVLDDLIKNFILLPILYAFGT
jgi:hypothetical protein